MKKSLPILAFLIALTAPLAWAEALQSEPTRADVVVYGATPAGIAAAVAAMARDSFGSVSLDSLSHRQINAPEI